MSDDEIQNLLNPTHPNGNDKPKPKSTHLMSSDEINQIFRPCMIPPLHYSIETLLNASPCTIEANTKYKEDAKQWFSKKPPQPPPPPPPPPPPTLLSRRQLTTDYTLNDLNPLTTAQKLVSNCALNLMGAGVRPDRTAPTPGNLGHDPRGLRFGFDGSILVTEADWLASKWDGVPYSNYAGVPKEELWRWLVPRGNNLLGILRGIEDLYYNNTYNCWLLSRVRFARVLPREMQARLLRDLHSDSL
jgi:hypothetical protein